MNRRRSNAGEAKAYTGGNGMVLCPECESDLDIEEEDMDEGDVVSCSECGSDFEVVTANPLELKKVDEEEDEDEDEDDEDEDEEDY